MTESISFGKGKNIGKIDLTQVKDGIKKEDIVGNNKKLGSIFDKVDKNGNQVLEKNELEAFHEELSKLAGEDNQLTDKEAKGFKDSEGHKMGRRHRKAFYEFLNKLAEQQQDPNAIQQQATDIENQVLEQTVAENPDEISEQVGETVIAQVADEIVDNNDDDGLQPLDDTVEEIPDDEETEPEVTKGIIVQNGESPAVIAKKFGVSVEDLLAANEGVLKGKGKNKYFLVGQEIVIPRKIEDEELAQLTKNRKSAAEATGAYAQAMAVREQQAENEALGLISRKGAGTKITGKYKGGQTEEFTVIGEAGRGRKVAQSKSGKIVTIAHDGTILNESYVQNTNFYDRKDTPKVTINGKQYAVAGSRGDKHGRSIAVDEKGNQVVLSADNKVLRNDYVSASDARDAGRAQQTLTGGKNITYVKDANGKVWYFDETTGKALIKGEHSAMVQQEADAATNVIYDAAHGLGTDEEKLAQGINMIYSPEIMAHVNKTLKTKDSDYQGDAMTKPIEALLLDELSRSEARGHIKTLADNGAYGTGAARDAALGRNAAREIQYEVHGGILGYTSTKDLKEAMGLASTRGARLATETHFDGIENEGSKVRQYIADDGWNPQEVDQFDAEWVKNGAYDHEHDQEHRNTVTGRLIFEYGNEKSLHAGLEAMDPDSADYEYVSTRATEENKKKGYNPHFNGQEALQTYIAGRSANDDGSVNRPHVSACNTLLYKGEKPVRIQAEEALYGAKAGNFSTMFDSMDPKVYEEMATMLADGEIPDCKNMQEAYNKALNGAKTRNDKTTIKANAIISQQIKFSDAEIADFCIELMHNIDDNKGQGASTGVSAKHTNTAEYMTEQLKAILQANPNVIETVKDKVNKGKFESSAVISSGTSGGPANIYTTDNKADYLKILNDTKCIVSEGIFLDKDGNKITNPEEIAALTNANMQALQGMREYVAQLERDFKKGVDAEGVLSDMANGILTYSGIGTDRDDVATQYRNAKTMLAQLEAAAQGKLRDSEGNVISAQDLAQKFVETQDKLAQTNSDYQSSMQMTRMGIVLAPVIAVTTVASGGTAALGWGTVASAATAGLAAGATTYGINALEYNTSLTGNTAEAREQNAIDSTVAAVSTSIGFAQMKPIMGMANNLNTVARTTVRLATTVASDVTVGAAGEYVSTGNVSAQGTLMNAGFSAIGNVAGVKSLGRKTDIPTPHIQPEVNLNGRDPIADGVVARNIDQQHLNANQRRMIEEGLADVPTPEELAAYQKEIAYQPVPEADRPAFDAHQQQVARDYADAHELGNMVDASSLDALQRAKTNMEADAPAPTPAKPKTSTPANQAEIEKLTQSISDIDKQIARAENNLATKAKRGKQPTLQEKQQLERMKANRAEKQAELEALQKTAAEPEVVVKPDEAPSEPVVKADEVEADVKPAAEAPTPENIVHDAQAIPDAEIPVEHRSRWQTCQEKIKNFFATGKELGVGEIKTVLADLKTVYNAVKNVQIRAKIKKLYNDVIAYAKSKQVSKPAVADTPAPVRNLKEMNPIEQSQSFNKTHKIDSDTRVADGYKDGGRGLRFDDNGNPINTPSREIILVDRQQDKKLQEIIADFKKKTAHMSEKKKAAFLQKYVYEISGSKHIKNAAMDAFDAANRGKEVLLGDIINTQPPVAVCRHRSLLYKILGDEVGLKVELQRGNFYDSWGGGGHAWNTVQFEDGTSAIFDSMHNKSSNITSGHVDDYAKKYFSVKDEDLYSNGLNNKHVNNGEIEVISVEAPVIEPQAIPDHSNAGASSKLSTAQRKIMMDKFEIYHEKFLDINYLRNKYPQYNSLSDTELLAKFALNEDHAAFVMNRKDLFGDGKYEEREYWNDSPFESSNNHSAWKMHLFSVDTNDYQQMAEVILPYLNKHKIAHKTLSSTMSPELLATSAPQQTGKAFTIYPQSQQEMEMIAKDLDRLIRQNNLTTGNSHITGDNQLGDSGRLFYRYEYPTGKLKDKIYKPGERAPYDSNRGEGGYLASDMTPADDPWLNFDPSNPNSKPGQTEPKAEAPAAAPRGLSPEQKAMVGEIGDAITRAKNNHSLDQAQAKIDRLPDSPEKRALQRQANEKSRELRRMEEPIEGRHEQEPYFVDVSDQAEIIAEPVPADYDGPIYEINENGDLVVAHNDDVIWIEPDAIATRAPKEISNDIDMAYTDVEFKKLQEDIDALPNGSEKRALQEKLNRKRQDANNYPDLAEYNSQTYEPNNEPYYDPANDPANWGMLDDFNNSLTDDFGESF